MSCCSSTHIRRLNRLTGSVEVINLASNTVETDAAVLARLEACPTREVISEQVCAQLVGNTDPNAIFTAKCLQTLSIAADGNTTVIDTTLLNNAGADITATHEVVECPIQDVIDIPVCDPGP